MGAVQSCAGLRRAQRTDVCAGHSRRGSYVSRRPHRVTPGGCLPDSAVERRRGASQPGRRCGSRLQGWRAGRSRTMISEFRFSVPPSMGMGKPSATSSPGLGSALPNLHRNWALPIPHIRRKWAHPCHCHICARTGLCPATSAAGKGSIRDATSDSGTGSPLPLPHLRWDWTLPCHICGGKGLYPLCHF
jgi:hypothetical protein